MKCSHERGQEQCSVEETSTEERKIIMPLNKAFCAISDPKCVTLVITFTNEEFIPGQGREDLLR